MFHPGDSIPIIVVLVSGLSDNMEVSELLGVVSVQLGYLGPAFAPSGFFSDADEIQAAL